MPYIIFAIKVFESVSLILKTSRFSSLNATLSNSQWLVWNDQDICNTLPRYFMCIAVYFRFYCYYALAVCYFILVMIVCKILFCKKWAIQLCNKHHLLSSFWKNFFGNFMHFLNCLQLCLTPFKNYAVSYVTFIT